MPEEPTLIEVVTVVPDVLVELRYAGSRHPFGEPLYETNRAFLAPGTARRLARALANLAPSGLKLKVWDAYRPLSVQAVMWSRMPDDDYVAPPSRGSRHNRGAAVDATLADARGCDVPMPTDFDDFTDAAGSSAPCPDPVAETNRSILRRAMLAAGFEGIEEEWWHFSDPDWAGCPLQDVSLHELAARADGAPS